MLAGISVEYYTRLERGNANGVSDDVLEGIVRALQLDEAERAHLFDLVRAARHAAAARRRPTQERVRPTRATDPRLDRRHRAYVRNERLDILAANRLGDALYSPTCSTTRSRPPNMARFLFLNPRGIGVLRRLGHHRPRRRRHPARRGRTRPVRQAPLRPHRRARPHAATSSASAGPPTTSSSTAPASSGSTTRSSVTSPSTTRRSTCPADTGQRMLRLHRRTRLAVTRRAAACSPAGRPPRPALLRPHDGRRPLTARPQSSTPPPTVATGGPPCPTSPRPPSRSSVTSPPSSSSSPTTSSSATSGNAPDSRSATAPSSPSPPSSPSTAPSSSPATSVAPSTTASPRTSSSRSSPTSRSTPAGPPP